MAFRRLSRDDFAVLSVWLAQPHVARWWNHDPSPAAVEADFGPSVDGTDPGEIFIAMLSERPLGLIQRYRLRDWPDYAAALAPLVAVPRNALGIDYLIGEPGALQRGFGAAMIRGFVERTWSDWPDVSAVIVAVSTANVASWRALERAGLARAGAGQMQPDNPIDDRDHVVYRIARPV